jgi:DNA polymerase I-like protein with 3'-5' exonuclease and polymerase domains
LEDGHSLKAWGTRLKTPKLEFDDFSQYSEKMLDYCKQDVILGVKIFEALTSKMLKRGYSEFSCRIEHQTRDIINLQQDTGFCFDLTKAKKFHKELKDKQENLGEQIHKVFPPTLELQNTYNKAFKKDGSPTALYEKSLITYPKVELHEDGSFSVYSYVEFNINSPSQRLNKLLDLNFKPQKKTKKGNPSVDEESLVAFANESGIPEVSFIAEYLVLQGRTSMVEGWIKLCREDSRIHGVVFSCGASSRRMTHNSPNSANVPGNDTKYGHECRSLWTATPGKILCGVDAKGLEMRCFGHYLNNKEAAYKYIEGDPHTDNANMLMIPRRVCKTVFYAFLYGATDPKLGSIVGKDRNWGEWARSMLIKNTPGLENLVKEVQYEFTKGQLKTIDGGYVIPPSPHSALNYKLQSAGAIVMKQGLIRLREFLTEAGLPFIPVGNIHDEWQLEANNELEANEIGNIGLKALLTAGEDLGFRVPIEGDYKTGYSWADTH